MCLSVNVYSDFSQKFPEHVRNICARPIQIAYTSLAIITISTDSVYFERSWSNNVLVNTTIAGTGIESEAVSSDILGANTLFHRDSTDQGSELDRVATLANVTYLRYPGGTVTEEYFDLSDPNSIRNPNVVQLISGNSSPQLRTITPLESFLDYCEIEGTEPVIVLPTYRFFDQETRRLDVDAEPIVKGFIVDILRGSYGSVNIRAFELGNEWYQDRFNWTAEEFGVFQVDLARWVSEAIDDTNVSSPPSILAQAGQTREENIILAGEFEGDDSNYVDGIIAHLYGANSSGNPLGVGGGIAQRLTDISTTWGDVSQSLDLAITEWNVGESGEETTLINGIMRSAPLLRIFAEMVRADVDLAAIWTATAPGPAGLGSESNGEVVLKPTGLLFDRENAPASFGLF